MRTALLNCKGHGGKDRRKFISTSTPLPRVYLFLSPHSVTSSCDPADTGPHPCRSLSGSLLCERLCLRRQRAYLLVTEREPTADQSTDHTEVQRGELMTLRGLLTEACTGEALSASQVHRRKPQPSWAMAHKSCSLQRSAQPAGSLTGPRTGFPLGVWAHESLYYGAAATGSIAPGSKF